MFLFTNKEKLRRSMIINEHEYARVLRGNILSGVALVFAAIGSIIMYLGFTDELSKTQNMLYILISFNVLAWFLIADHIFEIKFLKKLLEDQSPDNLFGEEEWLKIREAAQRPGISDKAIEQTKYFK